MFESLFLVPRDINERGRSLDQVLNQYMNFVKPAFEEFCSPVTKFFVILSIRFLILKISSLVIQFISLSDQKIC